MNHQLGKDIGNMNHPVDSKEFWFVSFALISILTICAGGIYSMSVVQERIESNLKQSIDGRHQQVLESFQRTDQSLKEMSNRLESIQSCTTEPGDTASVPELVENHDSTYSILEKNGSL